LYSALHLGAKASFGYISPFDDILQTTRIVLSNTILYVLSQILSFPLLSLPLMLSGAIGVIIAGVLLTILILIFREFLASNKRIAFFATGMVLSMVPFSLGMMTGDRLLLWAGLGAAGLLGELSTSQIVTSEKLQRICAKTLLFFNIVVSLLIFIPALLFGLVLENPVKAFEKKISSQNTVTLNGGGTFYTLYASAIRYVNGGEWPKHYYNFYDGADTLVVERVDERTIRATCARGWFGSILEKSTRPKQLYFKQGDTFNLELMTATIEKVTSDQRPLIVKFTLKKDLSEFAWMAWTKSGLGKCELPAIGKEIRLCAPPPF
jgi:hypothetical protein